MQRADLRLVDWICIGYLAVFAGLLLGFGHALDAARRHAAESVGIAVAIAVLAPLIGQRPGPMRALRSLYPLVVLLWAWDRLDGAIPLINGSFWASDLVVRADRALFGGHPTVMIQALHRPWLDEVMAGFYLSYYLFLAVPVLLVARRRYDAALAGLATIMLTYAVNFLLFFLLPAKSPQQLLDQYAGLQRSGFDGFVLTDLVRVLQSAESVPGAAFPSSHVAGAMACTLVAARTLPRLARALWLLLAGMTIATVYLGYHHAVDPIVGIPLGIGCFVIALRWLRRRGEIPGRL